MCLQLYNYIAEGSKVTFLSIDYTLITQPHTKGVCSPVRISKKQSKIISIEEISFLFNSHLQGKESKKTPIPTEKLISCYPIDKRINKALNLSQNPFSSGFTLKYGRLCPFYQVQDFISQRLTLTE